MEFGPLIIFGGSLLTIIALVAMERRGWIEVPRDSGALQMIGCGGVLVLGALVCLFIVASEEIQKKGLIAFVLGWVPLVLFLFGGGLVGYIFYRRRQKSRSVVQQLHLDE